MKTAVRKVAGSPPARPSYGPPARRQAPPEPKSYRRHALFLLAFTLVGGFFFVLSQMQDADAERRLADATTADEIARIVLGNSARVTPTTNGKPGISIHYDLAAWSLTRGSVRSAFMGNVIRLVPTVFQRLPETSQVELVADSVLDTIQGREVRQPTLSMMFTRPTARRINWESVTKVELPRLADRAWASPSIGWQ